MAAAVIASFRCDAFAESASPESEPVVLARATAVVLSARETHVVLLPVPVRRRPLAKTRPKTKGAKPAPPQMQLVLRDIVAAKGGPAYEVFLVTEGPNIFQATSRREQVGTLEFVAEPTDGEKGITVFLEANDAFAKLKIRGFSRNLRIALVRRAVKDEEGKESIPPDPKPPEIGAIELVQS